MTDDADVKLLMAGQLRIEKDLEKIGRQFENYLTQHASKHDTDAALNSSHLMTSQQAYERGLRNESGVTDLGRRLGPIEEWRHELLGAMRLVKIAFGTSILSAILMLITLFALFSEKGTP